MGHSNLDQFELGELLRRREPPDAVSHRVPGVEVPSKFFKIIVDEENGKPRMLAFVIPQGVVGNEQLRVFLVSVDAIEKQTGMDFFSDLDDQTEDKLEAAVPKEMW